MNHQEQTQRAQRFAALNRQGGLLLANAWDIASARVFEQEGFAALGTSSGAIAYAHGLGDAELMGREAMLAQVAAIAAAVHLPLTADIEAGYGAAPEAVALSVEAAIAAGAVGVNLEDRRHGRDGSGLFNDAEQGQRLAAARAAADRSGLPLWINARCDSFLLAEGADIEQRLALTLARGRAYLAAGADMVFVPGLLDLSMIRTLASGLGGPLSLMAMPGAPGAGELFAAGAQRVSLGVCPMLSVMGLLRDMGREALQTGSWQAMGERFYGFGEAEALFSGD
ncbi:isocitrate lyase/phosphoenolpyruvate mutase family protein [Paucibacter sp. DJ1R-11]|uniref:isocitrate lyase/PEP mutase family protein n=1 Tax=Paucibacter sp. DJ1R-11 TaxID=2893556 RepID=UPI0021E4C388|nr:isocitrate lyase/phosphoenolpyruvate mutase family protein [Paucibacter sp. DJ1R-11]MCV2363328.1 isocitrate lyase/phosphoenolpyruvate mutase family protein [Paucibacter sp. DJ1R-11]